jgi:hypothetical protein
MAVVKVAQQQAFNELREYTIDDDGLQIGTMVTGQHGLFGRWAAHC